MVHTDLAHAASNVPLSVTGNALHGDLDLSGFAGPALRRHRISRNARTAALTGAALISASFLNPAPAQNYKPVEAQPKGNNREMRSGFPCAETLGANKRDCIDFLGPAVVNHPYDLAVDHINGTFLVTDADALNEYGTEHYFEVDPNGTVTAHLVSGMINGNPITIAYGRSPLPMEDWAIWLIAYKGESIPAELGFIRESGQPWIAGDLDSQPAQWDWGGMTWNDDQQSLLVYDQNGIEDPPHTDDRIRQYNMDGTLRDILQLDWDRGVSLTQRRDGVFLVSRWNWDYTGGTIKAFTIDFDENGYMTGFQDLGDEPYDIPEPKGIAMPLEGSCPDYPDLSVLHFNGSTPKICTVDDGYCCPPDHLDMNGDGVVSFADTQEFFYCMGGQGVEVYGNCLKGNTDSTGDVLPDLDMRDLANFQADYVP